MKNKLFIQNAKLVSNEEVIENGALVIDGEKIAFAGKGDQIPLALKEACDETLNAKGNWLIPGFIDVHVHGGYGSDFMNADKSSLDTITRFHRDHGTTSILATTIAAPKSALDEVIHVVNEYMQDEMPYAQLLGVHLEGPFISSKWPGAHIPEHIVDPQLKWIQDWVSDYPRIIRIISIAPETPGALELIEWACKHDIIAACAHTNASYEEIERAVELGLNHGTHTFNAMTPLHHREPGTVGAVLSEDRICAEVIADGHHVHPVCIQILLKLKTKNNLILITDAVSAAGLKDGIYWEFGLEVIVQDGIARLKQDGRLFGSTITMISAFRFVVQKVGVSIPHACQLTSGNAAKQLGIDHLTGSLCTGKQADMLLLDEDLQLKRVWVKGK